ncbi:MAG: hypothetical protein H7Z19_15425 [Chitinophagaceae bacterium]|nr:hypothetical protein [Rubrivivax sp.]
MGCAPAAAHTVLVSSSFDFDNDGWERAAFVDGSGDTPAPWWPFGNGPGSLIDAGLDALPDGFSAPGKFLGNQSAALGGALMFQVFGLAGAASSGDCIRLTSGTLEISYGLRGPGFAPGTWVNYVVPLTASAGWETLAANPFLPRTPTTDAEMAAVLGSLTQLRIRSDWYLPPANGFLYLDNVRLVSGVPEVPSSAASCGTGRPAGPNGRPAIDTHWQVDAKWRNMRHLEETAMAQQDTPPEGGFSKLVDEQLELAAAKLPVLTPVHPSPVDHEELGVAHANIEDLLLGNAEATPEMLEEMAALENAPELSEEELARQALAHGGADNDPATPE